MSTESIAAVESVEVVALMTAWALWQKDGHGTVKPMWYPSQAVEGSRHNFAGQGRQGKKEPTARGKETVSTRVEGADRHWSPDVAKAEAGLMALRSRRIDLFLVLIAHYMDWVPNGRGGWRHVPFDETRGAHAHRTKLAAMMGSKRLPNGRLRPTGPREFANRLREAHAALEVLLPT